MSTEDRSSGESGSLAIVEVGNGASLERWMTRRFAQRLGIDASEIDVERSFSWFGIDSVAALELLEELEQMLDCVISPVTFYEKRNIRALATYLAEHHHSIDAKPSDSCREVPRSAGHLEG